MRRREREQLRDGSLNELASWQEPQTNAATTDQRDRLRFVQS
jgi:hypothetical protein